MTPRAKQMGWWRGWNVASTSDPLKKYRVSERRDGTFGCSCPAWKFHPAPKVDCKHIVAIRTNSAILTKARASVDSLGLAIKKDGTISGESVTLRADGFIISSILAPARRMIREDE